MDKIFGIGLPRTATTSLSEAMQILGYNSLHTPIGLHHFMKYDFTGDNYTTINYKFLDYIFPDAKFIVTTREINSWVNSERLLCNEIIDKQYVNQLTIDVAEQRFDLFKTTLFDENKFVCAYYRHMANVLEHFDGRLNKLLFINICGGQGWETLCPFLNKEIPNKEFPYLNRINKKGDSYMLYHIINYDNIPMSDKGVLVSALYNIEQKKVIVKDGIREKIQERIKDMEEGLEYMEPVTC